MEDELKKLKQEIEALKEWIDTLDTFVGKLDAEGKLIFCNKAPLKAGGIELEEVYGKYFPDTKWFSHSKTEQKKVTEAIKKAKQGISSRMETSIRDISGGSISIIFNTQPVIKEGKVKYITIEGKTILQEKRLQEELERKVKERTSALAESEEKYRTLVENSSDGFVIIQDGQFVFVNQAMCKILNLSKKDILKKNVIEFISSEERQRALENIKRVMKYGPIGIQEYKWIKAGEIKYLQVSSSPITYKGKPALQTMVRDITEKKKIEDKIKREREAFSAVAKAVILAPDASKLCHKILNSLLKILNFDFGAVRIYNEKSKTLIPIAVSGLVKKQVREKISTQSIDDKKYVAALVARTKIPIFAPDVKKHKILHTHAQRLNELGINSIISYPLIGEKRTLLGVVQLCAYTKRDIPKEDTIFFETIANMWSIALEDKLKGERVFAEKERLSVTLRSIGDGVIVTDAEGKVIMLNKVAEDLTGWKQEKAIGKPLEKVFVIINEHTRKRCENPFERVINTGGIVGLANDTVVIARDGTERLIADSGAPIKDHTGKIIGVIIVFRDVTEKRKREQELMKMEKLESLGVLAGGIAHDFNNVLTGILGNITLAKTYSRPEDEVVIKKLENAENICLRGKGLSQQLLTFAKGGEPVKKVISMAELIRDAVSFALSGSNVRCEFSIPDDLWLVEADEGQIAQAIQNIIINADQAMPTGGVIKVICENVVVTKKDNLPLKAGRYLKISFKDQGVGIPKKYLSKIFDPFFTTKKRGSGLGLSTAYSIIKKHHGHIFAKSKVGEGSIFYLYLPASKKTKIIEDIKEEFKGKGRVLIMDDEEMILEVLGEMLNQLGYETEFAKDGYEAIDLYKKALLEKKPFDAVILDLTVPGSMGGEEAIKRLSEIDPDVKGIVSSGYSTDPIMADYKKYGFCGAIAKPYRMVDLAKVLKDIIS